MKISSKSLDDGEVVQRRKCKDLSVDFFVMIVIIIPFNMKKSDSRCAKFE